MGGFSTISPVISVTARCGLRLLEVREFTTSTTYTPPPEAKLLLIIAWAGGGGGGGGGGGYDLYKGGGGGGGSASGMGVYVVQILTKPPTLNIIVGSGGSGGSGGLPGSNGSKGGLGGDTVIEFEGPPDPFIRFYVTSGDGGQGGGGASSTGDGAPGAGSIDTGDAHGTFGWAVIFPDQIFSLDELWKTVGVRGDNGSGDIGGDGGRISVWTAPYGGAGGEGGKDGEDGPPGAGGGGGGGGQPSGTPGTPGSPGGKGGNGGPGKVIIYVYTSEEDMVTQYFRIGPTYSS